MTNKKNSGTVDLTVGSPIKQIILFALPLVAGTLFQQLYSFVDTVIVGRCLGSNALGAVGTTYSLNFLIIGFIQGCCVGFGIPVSESFGGKDKEGLHKYLVNGALICAIISILFTIATVLLAGPLLRLINTPEELYNDAVLYIRIIFIGIPTTVLYNYASSVLRSLGDSKHPFYFLLVSSILNIVLDYVLIIPFKMGVDGAAIATVISQLLSGILCTFWFFEKTCKQEELSFTKNDLKFSSKHIKRLSYIGLPMGFEYSVSAIGAVVMQDAINLLGSNVVAAQTAGEKIRQMFTLPMESVGMAMATYVGQNHGAHKNDRIKQGIKDGCKIQLTYCVIAWAVIFFIKSFAVKLVLGNANQIIIDEAIEYLSIISILFIFHGLLMIFRNTLQGLGNSVQAIISGVGELLGRTVGGLLATKTSLGYFAICVSNPLAWAFALSYCVFMVIKTLRKENRNNSL